MPNLKCLNEYVERYKTITDWLVDDYFATVVQPAINAFNYYKAGKSKKDPILARKALKECDKISCPCWRAACTDWINRRKKCVGSL